MSWKTVAKKVVYENRWIRVREDDVIQPDGEPGIYGVVERADFVVVLPFDGTNFYLVEQYRYPVAGRHWEFPQGSWDNDPADFLAVAHGELAEETGLRAGSMKQLGSLYPAYGMVDQQFHVFLATDLVQGEHAREATELDMQVAKVSYDDLRRRILEGDIQDGTTVAAFALFQLSDA